MTQDERIRHLEEAVLYLSKALNDLIAAQQASRMGEPAIKGLLWTNPDDAVRSAYKNISKVVDLMSVEEASVR